MSSSGRVRRAAALGVAIAAFAARGNGGGSEIRASGAVAGASGAPLGTTELISIPEIECVSEALTIWLGPAGASVAVEYVLRNHGEARTIDYAFPFAVGEVVERTAKGERIRRLGEPNGYFLAVDGARAASTMRPGAPVPAAIPVPSLAGRRDAARYVWSYRVARIDFPAGRTRRLSVRYSAPYLAYTKTMWEGDSEIGSTTGQGTFSYILSTGGGWRNGTIGKLSVRVSSGGQPSDLWPQGLPFRRERKGWSFEARDFRPTLDANILIRRPKWKEMELGLAAAQSSGWESDPISSSRPGQVELEVEPEDAVAWGDDGGDKGRYRLALDLGTDPEDAQPARLRVALDLGEMPPEVFHATFARTSEADLNDAGWRREIWFEAPSRPRRIALTFLDVVPGKGGGRRLKIQSAALHADVGDYDWGPWR